MLGKANEIKTTTIYETQYENICEAVNRNLEYLGESIILDIKYSSQLINSRYWGSALIIYKEAESNAQTQETSC